MQITLKNNTLIVTISYHGVAGRTRHTMQPQLRMYLAMQETERWRQRRAQKPTKTTTHLGHGQMRTCSNIGTGKGGQQSPSMRMTTKPPRMRMMTKESCENGKGGTNDVNRFGWNTWAMVECEHVPTLQKKGLEEAGSHGGDGLHRG